MTYMRLRSLLILITAVVLSLPAVVCGESGQRELRLEDIADKPIAFRSEVGESGEFIWWLPAGADEYVLPISSGLVVDASRADLLRWLQEGSPWSLLELPVLGLRFRNQTIVVIVPWPHYAELIVTDRIGIRYAFPKGREQASPCEIVALRRGADVLESARAFREWRVSATNTGAIPRPRSLATKMVDLERVNRLPGAPHIYLWGPATFSKHDVARGKWLPFAKLLKNAAQGTIGGRLVASFSEDQRRALQELAGADWPMDYLTSSVAGGIDAALSGNELLKLGVEVPAAEVIRRNRQTLAAAFAGYVNPSESWGDGLSMSMLDALDDAGVDRALLLLSDLYGRSFRPDVLAHAEKLGFLVGPYDSYHSVHSPAAGSDDTWETAQFDAKAYEQGRVMNADGSARAGFKRRGYHLAPEVAWPYVQDRVGRMVQQSPFSAWFIDCDATAECFDDFSNAHPATKYDDTRLRRQRLAWLEAKHKMVVGSEGGSVLFADVIHFGHGVHTPYVGHLSPSLKDASSRHYIGRFYPPDIPDQSFKAITIPPSLKMPYFDPAVRIPLYQAALGDELIATHHWSFDSLKLKDVGQCRELLEILYMVPPMYHLNRESWPQRRSRMLRHLAFWGPLHRKLATAPLTRFTWLSADRLVQRTTFQHQTGEVTITVNFGDTTHAGYPPHSATVSGSIAGSQSTYHAEP